MFFGRIIFFYLFVLSLFCVSVALASEESPTIIPDHLQQEQNNEPSQKQCQSKENVATTRSIPPPDREEILSPTSKKSWSLDQAARKAISSVSRRIALHCMTGSSIDPLDIGLHAIAGVFGYTMGMVWDNRDSVIDIYLNYSPTGG